MKKINLDELKSGQAGITPIIAEFLVEAAVFCLLENKHQSGVKLKGVGNYEKEFELHWTGSMTQQMKKAWKDRREATEYGATAIAALLSSTLL